MMPFPEWGEMGEADWSLDDLQDERFHVAHLIFDHEQGALPSTAEGIEALRRELAELDARIADKAKPES
jgi:hypothetical protein